jgi:septal ring-binding cell division protein DamX
LIESYIEKSRNMKKSKKVEDKPVKENNNGKLGFFREIDESDNAEYIDISKIEAVHPSTFGLKKLEFVDSNDNSENTSQSYAQVGTKASKPVKKKEKPQKKVREKAPPKEKKKRKPINYKKILLRAALLLLLLSMGYSFYNVYMGWNTINLFAGKLYHSQMDKKEVKAAPKDTLSKKTVDEKPIITETKLDTIKPAETPKIDSTPAREIAHVQPAETKEIIPTKPAEIKPEKKIEKEPVKEIVSNKIDKTKPIKEKKKPKPEKIELTKIDPNINDIKPEPAVPVIVEKPEPAIVKAEQHGLFVVEVYSTPSQTDANEWLNLLKKKKVSDCFITKRLIRDKMIYRVRFGSYETKSEALEASRKLGFTSSWIDRIR